jgi:uncharacterized protein YbjT (DUF2867 family)
MIAVIGATGFTGHRIVHALRHEHPDEELIAVVRPSSQRRRLAGSRVTYRIADVRHTRDLTSAIAGCRHVVCATSLGFGDAPSICAALAAESRDHAVLFSTTSIFSQVPSASRATRIAAEEAVRAASFPATIVRPTMIYGRPGDRNIERLLRFLGRSPWAPTVDCGRALQQPVHVDDLAVAAAALLDRADAIGCAFNLAGPEALPFAELVQECARVIGRRVRLLSLPLGPSLTAARWWGRMHLWPRITPEQVLRMREDKACDITPARAHFGYSPRVFAEGAAGEAALLRRGA